MFSRQVQSFFQQPITGPHLLQLHSLILKTALDHDEYVFSKFILLASTVSIKFTRLIFEDSPITPPIFAWNTIVKVYSKSSTPNESLNLFSKLQRVGLEPDKFTYPFVIKACGRCSMLGAGKSVHSLVLKTGFVSDKYVRNTLLAMYGTCGEITLARKLFDEMCDRDVVSWSSLIAGYVNSDRPLDALMVFQGMKLANEKPNHVTLVSLLAACTCLLNIRLGEPIHAHILLSGIPLDVALGTALLEMYAKCGHIEKAFQIFNFMGEKNLQSWTVMISGLANHGLGEEAINFFAKMEESGLKPDGLSFSGILSACSHLGLIDEGQRYFDQMVRIYNIRPTVEHYGCMVDMYARAGMVEEAYEIIRSMPMEPNPVILRSFISLYKHHSRCLSLNENLKKNLLELEPNLGANYVLAANLSSMSGYWKDVVGLRVAMKDRGLKKVPGCSWVEGNNNLQNFCLGSFKV